MREPISIWCFSGVLLFIYGILILASGLWELRSPLLHPPVLHQLHAPIWWGAMLAVIGLWYLIEFWPHKRASQPKD